MVLPPQCTLVGVVSCGGWRRWRPWCVEDVRRAVPVHHLATQHDTVLIIVLMMGYANSTPLENMTEGQTFQVDMSIKHLCPSICYPKVSRSVLPIRTRSAFLSEDRNTECLRKELILYLVGIFFVRPSASPFQ